MNNSSNSYRYHLLHTLSGKSVLKSNTLEAIRSQLTKKEAEIFTIHDTKRGEFYSATRIFKDEVHANHKTQSRIS